MTGQRVAMKRRVRLAMLTLVYTTALLITVAFIGQDSISVMNPGEVKVPIIMYHSILRDKSRVNKYVVSVESLENDMKFLFENDYKTVFISDLVSYVYEGTALPEKPVVLSFDDGHYNNLVYLCPLLEKYDMVACISTVGAYTEKSTREDDGNPNYSYCTWEEIKKLSLSGRVEIVNHSFDMHSTNKGRMGAKQKSGESRETYTKILTNDTMRNQELLRSKSGTTPICYAYPFGYYSKLSEEILRSLGFKATLSCYERVNRISGADSLYGMGRYNRDGRYSTEAFMRRLGIIGAGK